MNRWIPLRRVLIQVGGTVVVLLGFLCGTATSQGLLSPACNRNCPPHNFNPLDPNVVSDNLAATDCETKEASCQALLTTYYAYMGQLDLGVTMRSLPNLYVELLQPFYPGTNLAGFRFGFSDRQPAIATTDCTKMYANNQARVNRWADGSATSDTDLLILLHELQHVRQCSQVGGRDFYAVMWFSQMSSTVLASGDMTAIHDAMPMEGDANNRMAAVLQALATNRDIPGKLVRPLRATLINPASGSDVSTMSLFKDNGQTASFNLGVQISGGSDPLNVEWRVVRPNSPVPQVAQSGANRQFTFTATELGTHEVRATVSQAGSQLVPALDSVQINVVRRPSVDLQPVVKPGVGQLPSSIQTHRLTVQVDTAGATAVSGGRIVPPTLLNGATVRVGTSSNPTSVGSALTKSGVAVFENILPSTGSATLTVTATLTGCTAAPVQFSMPARDHTIAIHMLCKP